VRTIAPLTALLLLTLPAQGPAQDAQPSGLPRTPAPAGAELYFLTPEDGASVSSPFTVRFGLRGMGVAPAGVTHPDTGHHHLLVNVDQLPPDDMPLPTTDQVLHFGMGQTETVLELPPGEHTLQLVLGDALHIPHDPPVRSQRITITVIE
jgi:hypothetical protein